MKRLLAIIVPLILTGGPAMAAAPSPGSRTGHVGRASRTRQSTPKPAFGVTIESVSPARYLTGKGTLQVRGRLTNQSVTPEQRVSVRLLYGARPLTSRGELDLFASGKGSEPAYLGPKQLITASIPPEGQQRFRLTIPVRRMGLTTWGVYPISIEAYNAAGAQLGRQRTFVVYYPKGTIAARTKIAWVWPVVDQPHRADDETFVDDRLERQFGSERLAGLVSAAGHTQTPVSWLIDPGLVDDAAHMADQDGYTLKDDVQRPRSVAAASWLGALHTAVGTERVIATPYADPDVMALAQRHMSRDLIASTKVAVARLGGAGLPNAGTTVSAPPGGVADQATLSALAASGARTVLLSSMVLPDYAAQTYTPDPLTTKSVGHTDLRLVAYDATLQRILSLSDPALAEQRFLAETAMITAETPTNSRTVVAMPPRRWNPDPAFAKNVLSYSAHVPWLKPVTLTDVERLKPVSRVFQPQRDVSGFSRAYLRQITDLHARINRFTSIFEPPTTDFPLGVYRLESSAWSARVRRGAALRTTLGDELTGATAKIHVLNDGDVTMAGRTARMPITISNGLDKGMVKVRLRVSSQNEPRLRVVGVNREFELEPGHKETVIIKMAASANGSAKVNVDLLAPDGIPFGKTRVINVRVAGYGRTALLITGISLAVLFLGVGYRVIRRRAERAEEPVD
jgi:hypothetical protein